MNKLSYSMPELEAFAQDLTALRKEISRSIGPEDFQHLKHIERFGRLASLVGYLTAWIVPNPISAVLMSYGNLSRWIIAHHILHGGYDRVPGIPRRYTSKGFARGLRRFLDWPDWMAVEAWSYEHNVLHHYYTGEVKDPDLAEANFEDINARKIPVFLKYALIGAFMLSWKFTYYAPNTFYHLNLSKKKPDPKSAKTDSAKPVSNNKPTYWQDLFTLKKENRKLWAQCYLPYGLLRFGIIPAVFLPLGKWAYFSVLMNSLIAEIFTNIHSFIVIVPNHAGEDLYRFDGPSQSKGEFYVRQVVGSTNFNCGNNRIDMLHGWLNYQIEHHIWPDLPMLKYQQFQTKVKALCEKHRVPYVQESVWQRLRKTIDISVGKTQMLRTESLMDI